MNPRASARLPAPRVRFGQDFLPRLGQLRRVLQGVRERREGGGRAQLSGVGAEFRGFRPYRPGEDLRMLDWCLLARTGRPFVRVSRREASEDWAVLVDTSASMGVGGPLLEARPAAHREVRGKLQLAAEVATGICALGVGEGAAIELVLSSGSSERLCVRRAHGVKDWMRRFEATEAAGDVGLARAVAEPARVRKAGAVFLIGDFLDIEALDVLRFQRRGRQLFCVQVLAPFEILSPQGLGDGGIEWIDAEGSQHRKVGLDSKTGEAYDRLISARLETMRAVCARHGIAYGVWSSEVAFEDVIGELFR